MEARIYIEYFNLRKMYDAESVLDIQGLSSFYSPLLMNFLRLAKTHLAKGNCSKKKLCHHY